MAYPQLREPSPSEVPPPEDSCFNHGVLLLDHNKSKVLFNEKLLGISFREYSECMVEEQPRIRYTKYIRPRILCIKLGLCKKTAIRRGRTDLLLYRKISIRGYYNRTKVKVKGAQWAPLRIMQHMAPTETFTKGAQWPHFQ